MSDYVRFTLVLTVVCTAAAGGIGGIYALTEKTIIEKARETERLARTDVLPDAKSFEQLAEGSRVYAGRDDEGKTVGYVAVGKAGGYGGELSVMVGLDTDGKIVKAAVLIHNETPGLGAESAKTFSEDTLLDVCCGRSTGRTYSWMDQFGGKKKVDLAIGKGIDARTGCTITSKAIVEAAKDAIGEIEKQLDAKSD